MSSKPPPASSSATSRIFAVGKAPKAGERGAGMTRERIASDLAAFHATGGHIEVLGTTRLLTRIGGDPAPPVAEAALPAVKPARRGKA
ncbi:MULTISPECIES: hypothetical protein [unclassified Luteimonas]|uniref:hypothetical protein n=1 Tax=unclassified Luteimonas TaxID=2629088 RepID=UPI001CC6FB32|nr:MULTISPECIES: hypothetical protein [unclassified Luteimonas]